jgi:hypothetical protein
MVLQQLLLLLWCLLYLLLRFLLLLVVVVTQLQLLADQICSVQAAASSVAADPAAAAAAPGFGARKAGGRVAAYRCAQDQVFCSPAFDAVQQQGLVASVHQGPGSSLPLGECGAGRAQRAAYLGQSLRVFVFCDLYQSMGPSVALAAAGGGGAFQAVSATHAGVPAQVAPAPGALLMHDVRASSRRCWGTGVASTQGGVPVSLGAGWCCSGAAGAGRHHEQCSGRHAASPCRERSSGDSGSSRQVPCSWCSRQCCVRAGYRGAACAGPPHQGDPSSAGGGAEGAAAGAGPGAAGAVSEGRVVSDRESLSG